MTNSIDDGHRTHYLTLHQSSFAWGCESKRRERICEWVYHRTTAVVVHRIEAVQKALRTLLETVEKHIADHRDLVRLTIRTSPELEDIFEIDQLETTSSD
jgi:hypothetical protein